MLGGIVLVMNQTKTVLVFGAFDTLHDGHRFFLREGRKLGDRLVVAVAQDSVIERLKGRPPQRPLALRLAALLRDGLVDEAVAGDTELGNWSALKKYQPDTIALGYDQTRLKEKLEEFLKTLSSPPHIVVIPAHKPKILHSRLLREEIG